VNIGSLGCSLSTWYCSPSCRLSAFGGISVDTYPHAESFAANGANRLGIEFDRAVLSHVC
jgi:hypothetical protein